MVRSGHSSSRSRSRSRSRSTSASKSRSRSRSPSQSRSRRRSRSRSRSPRRATNLVSQRRRNRSRSLSPLPGHRVHVADLGIDCTKREIQDGFERFGPIIEVWMARNPPCFAFVVYEKKEDAETAVKEMNGAVVCNYRVRVTHARPRAYGRQPKGSFNPSLRCYQCGERGHFSRDCSDLESRRRISSSRPRPDRYASHRAGYSRRYVDERPRERRYSSGSPRKTAEKRSRSRSRSPTANGRRPSSTSQKKFRVGL